MNGIFDLTGQAAVITGCSTTGFGFQMAKALASFGANVVLLARRYEPLAENAEKIASEYGVKALAVACDVTDTEQVNAACRRTVEAFGRVDILINNAGAGFTAPAEEMPDDGFLHEINVDLVGTFKCSRAFGGEMIKAGYGRIINIASMYGLVGSKPRSDDDRNCASAYHAAKGGVVNYTRALAGEWGRYGITVNSICPGYFITDLNRESLSQPWSIEHAKRFTPVGRYGVEGELNTCVVFLASKNSSFVTGQNIAVDGGYTAI